MFVPRFNGGSVPLPEVPVEEFAYNMGFPPDKLRLGDTYTPIVEELQKAGYEMYVCTYTHAHSCTIDYVVVRDSYQ